MKYQLVIQFGIEGVEDFDELVALEETMRTELVPYASTLVDGHDSGSGEFNIFIHTDVLRALFHAVANIIEDARPGAPFSAGHRAFDDDNYVVLWPPGLKHFNVA